MIYADRKRRLEETFKPRQEWWSRVFATPVAHAALHLVADWQFITPNRLTLASFFLTLLTAGLIVFGSSAYFLGAAFVLQFAYILDCMDGQLARYRGVSSAAGSFLDKWSDFVKFPAIILALTLSAAEGSQATSAIVLGFLTLFFICYQPYLRFLANSELSIKPSQTAIAENFFQRNILRLLRIEEAQWYLIVSLCLLAASPIWALRILCVTQGVVSLVQTIRIFKTAHP